MAGIRMPETNPSPFPNMADMEKLLNVTPKQMLKLAGLGVLGAIVLGTVISVYFSLTPGYVDYAKNTSGASRSYDEMAKTRSYLNSLQGTSDGSESGPAAAIPIMEIKSYDATVRTADPKAACDAFVSGIDRTWAMLEHVDSSKDSCGLTVLVKKEREESFLSSLRAMGLYDLRTGISNIRKPYAETVDRIAELQKRLAETDALLNATKTQYDDLWTTLKARNASAESIDALNRIITNKADLVSRFSKERLSLLEQIDALNKTKAENDVRLANVEFRIAFTKHVLIDWENTKETWGNDFQRLVSNLDTTFRALTIDMLSFLLKILNVATYLAVT